MLSNMGQSIHKNDKSKFLIDSLDMFNVTEAVQNALHYWLCTL
ncbi:unnamed protein product [Acanthoscelides obtectus]|uniref:Uncharacterized protein n=1 Tax=Acanthoscelides obtectus TaxID=200917 RepID=A0A9P0PT52_ACAOB|nr:unnamed protein product [Acanthoscelides obtectus]CAK1655267.1 hypothetical protein AOBTE_LOCUS19116 [Acanthoscelides obtectus]